MWLKRQKSVIHVDLLWAAILKENLSNVEFMFKSIIGNIVDDVKCCIENIPEWIKSFFPH